MSIATDLNTFHSMALPATMLQVLDSLDYITPTPIQAQTIPLALEHNDVLGSAQTGTGKTLAFVLPLIAHLLDDSTGSGLILTPTRELAQQVIAVVKKILGNKSPIKAALLIGGEPFFKQLAQLKLRPRIIVGTPGRIIDHLSRRTISPNFNFLVLDETDRMFDMGFGIQLEDIVSQLPKKRQTLMFSATFPSKVEKLASKYLIKPQRVFLNSGIVSLAALTEEIIKVKESEKYSKLLIQLKQREGSIIIFVKTKSSADRLSEDLHQASHSVAAMHGDLKQSTRTRVMNDFRNGRYQIMVATDVAARGLDVPHIQHVINYDLPNCPEDYVHRVGRTARAGANGSALNLIANHDQSKWDAIQRFISPDKFPEKHGASNSSPRSNSSRSGGAGRFSSGRSRSGSDRFGSARPNSDRSGSSRFGAARTNSDRSGSDRYSAARPAGATTRSFSARPGADRYAQDKPAINNGPRKYNAEDQKRSPKKFSFTERKQAGFFKKKPTRSFAT